MTRDQFGRTMMEMMAILAIIGILSVSGLQMYAKAMNTIRVNHLMEKVYLLANQIRNKEIEKTNRRKAFDLPTVDETLSYGFAFKESESGYKNKQIEVVITGDFSAKICKILNKKLKDDTNGNGLGMIDGCNADASQITFVFAPDFKAKKKRTVYIASTYEKAKKEYESAGGGSGTAHSSCSIEGALTCNPLVCDTEAGWFEFEDAKGHCEQCPAGYFCEQAFLKKVLDKGIFICFTENTEGISIETNL